MKNTCLMTFVAVLAVSCCGDLQVGDFSVSPLPKVIDLKDGDPFVFGRRVVIRATDELETVAGLLASDLEEALGKRPEISDNKGNIVLLTDASLPAEGYRIECGKDAIRIAGGGPAGVLYGAKTLYKALPLGGQGRVALPAALVEDAPEYSYRGFLVDVGRHFFTVDYLEEQIDIMALHG
ncbi:MAG: beta-N-acetylhexosaminidase, partial [Bacteroidales bacterium]|nr:beta-N-acetylhexosaminidase [Bacteroidales bacterium]